MPRRDPVSKKLKRTVEADTIARVIQLEKEVWRVAQQRDAAAFRNLVPADAIMIFQSGLLRQPDYVRTMNSRTISGYKMGAIRGFMPAPGTVILHYKATRMGEESGASFPEGQVIESTTWIKRQGRWVAVLNQETPISTPPRSKARRRI